MKVLAVLLLATAVLAAPQESAWMRIHGGKNSPRITGGDEVEPHSIPWQVGLDIITPDGNYFCGGSLIAPDVVLTAAHCGELSDDISVTSGAHYIRNATEETQQKVNAKTVIIHPAWDSQKLVNDICLLKLEKAFELNDNVKTIALPTRAHQTDDFAGRIGTATGWGLDSDSAETISPVLRTVNAPIITNAQCRTKFGIIGIGIPLHPTNVCIDTVGGKSTCSGDSGGPLFVKNTSDDPTVVGLTSFGVSLGCEKGYPAVFTRITQYLDWISLESGIPIQN